MPILDKLTFKNPLFLWLNRRGYLQIKLPLLAIVHRHFGERKKVWEQGQKSGKERTTLVDLFLTAEKDNQEKTKLTPEKSAVGMVLAGSETT